VLDTRAHELCYEPHTAVWKKGRSFHGYAFHSYQKSTDEVVITPDFNLDELHAGRSCQTRAAIENVEIDNNRRS
jgi:hypothetical protein